MTLPSAITVSRMLGSGGTRIALSVARQLSWHFCDGRILRQAARELNVPLASLREQEERSSGFLEYLLSMSAFASPEVPYAPPPELPVYSKDIFEVESDIMRRLVERESAVLVGRGGFIALRDRPATLHVRIEAGLDYRIRHLLATGKAADAGAALRAIKISDHNRTEFCRQAAGIEWTDRRPFHLVLNTEETSPEQCVQEIVAEARKRFSL
ncbi:MAG TPA: cytidylate kinase-like family protein [Geothrix sp.]|nr:cytidylate kinase-like family protein [Geothrix sp.]